MNLSQRETQTLNFIRAFIDAEGRSPYFYEIANHLGITSRGSVSRMIDSMARKGAVSRIPYVPGSLSLPEAVAPDPIQLSLAGDVRAALDRIADAESVTASTLISEWVAERVSYELRAKARAA